MTSNYQPDDILQVFKPNEIDVNNFHEGPIIAYNDTDFSIPLYYQNNAPLVVQTEEMALLFDMQQYTNNSQGRNKDKRKKYSISITLKNEKDKTFVRDPLNLLLVHLDDYVKNYYSEQYGIKMPDGKAIYESPVRLPKNGKGFNHLRVKLPTMGNKICVETYMDDTYENFLDIDKAQQLFHRNVRAVFNLKWNHYGLAIIHLEQKNMDILGVWDRQNFKNLNL